MTWSVDNSRPASGRLRGFMGGTRENVSVLLIPQRAIDVAAREQLVVARYIVNAAALEHHDGVRLYQRGQAVRDDDERAVTCDPPQVGVDDRLAFGVE